MYIGILILKSRALTTITQRIERDLKKIRGYATVFRDSGSEVKFPGLSRKIREGWQICGQRGIILCVISLRDFAVILPFITGNYNIQLHKRLEVELDHARGGARSVLFAFGKVRS